MARPRPGDQAGARPGRPAARGPAAGHHQPAGRAAYQRLAGATLAEARTRITALLDAAGDLRGEPEPVLHPVKFYEKGDAPLEIITTRQWYLSNGSGDPRLREALLDRGRELTWHPPHMRVRYENWVNGLTGDWLISRQRFSGVPIPVWYPLDDDGRPRLRLADHAGRGPAAGRPGGRHAPRVRRRSSAAAPGGFTGDPDVMDTWATSSLTPQIAGGWPADEDLFARVYPMDLRPQAHEIIRTWLFYTVLRVARRVRRAAVAARRHLRLDPRPGPQEDVQVPGQRGDPDGPAARVRHGRGPVLGRQRAGSASTRPSIRPS